MTLKYTLTNLFLKKMLSKIEKIVKIFSISNKFFSKLIYYCMLLEHTSVKSLKEK